MEARKGIITVALLLVVVLFAAVPASATLLTVDEIIYQGSGGGTTVTPGLLSGTIDYYYDVVNGQIIITIRNTSPDAAFVGGGSPALMLLTGFGINLGVTITGGTVTVGAGSTALNFGGLQSTTNISNQWEYNNGVAGQFTGVDFIASSQQIGGTETRFAGPPPQNVDGPGYGAVSALETEFGSSKEGVQDTIVLTLNFTGSAPSFATVNAAKVVLAFGSPTAVCCNGGGGSQQVPEPALPILLGAGLAAVAVVTRRHLKK